MKKNRKVFATVLMSVFAIFFGMFLTGCGKRVSNIEIISGVPVAVVNDTNQQPDYSNVRAKIYFEDGTDKTVGYESLIFGEIDMSTAGIKDVTVSYKDSEYKITIKVTVIDSTEINAEITAHSGTYDGKFHDAVAIDGARAGDTILYSTNNGQNWSNLMPQFKNAGTYSVTVKISREYRTDLIETKTITISKKQLEVKAEDKRITYGDSLPSFTYKIEGFAGSETEDVLTKLPQISCAGTNAGTYDIIVKGAEADNYAFNYTKGSLVIDKATYNMSNVVWDYSTPFTYDGTEKTISFKNLPEGVTAVYSNNKATNAGTYTANVVSFNYDKTNYNEPILPQGVQTTCEWIINLAQNTINYSVNGYSGEYDNKFHQIELIGVTNETVEYSTDGRKTWQTQVPERREIGTTIIDIKITKPNFEAVYLQSYITITKISNMGITASGYIGDYTGDQRQIILHGKLSGDIVKYSLDNGTTWQDKAPLFRNATDGLVTVLVKISREMYEDEQLEVHFNIKRVQLTIKVDDKAVKYGEAAPEFTATYTGFVNNEKAEIKNSAGLTQLPTFTCNYTIGANAGTTFDIVASGAEAKNYTIVYEKGTLTVEKAEVAKPTKNTTTFVYNGQQQTYLPNGYDATKMNISNNIQKDASPDAYSVSVIPNSNYVWADTKDSQAISFTFAIEQKVAEIVWQTTNLVYTGEAQAPICEVTNLFEKDVCLVTVSGKQTNVGTSYTATAVSLDNSNYKLPTDVTCTFQIEKATNEWLTRPTVVVNADGTVVNIEAKFGNDNKTIEFKKSSESDDAYTTVSPKLSDRDTYTARITIEGTENYSSLQTTYEFIATDLEVESIKSALLTRDVKKFINQNNNLVAGSDNEYDLQVVGTTKTTGSETLAFDLGVTVKVKNESGEYSDVANDGMYYDYNAVKHTLNFTQAADGKTFKIFAKAGTSNELEYIVDVVSGYNVYTAQDLSVIENKGIHDWDKFKQGTIYENITTNAVVIQKDIKVTNADIPAEFFYTEAEASAVPNGLTNQTIVGTLKDGDGNGTGGNSRAIYHREVSGGETFGFYGNYFNIDYSNLTKSVIQSGHEAGVVIDDTDTSKEKLITTHISFLKFNGVGKTSNINFVDASFVGNGQRSSRSANSGGTMLVKFNSLNSNVKNCVYSNCFIGFMYEAGEVDDVETTNIITDSKGTDSYNTLIYVYGLNKLHIQGGEYVGAGGPVMIVDHVGNDKSTGENGYPSNITIVGTKLESLITGNEPWFVSYGATALIPQITALNAAYNDFGTSYLVTDGKIQNLMNLKVVYKSSSAEGVTASVVRGGVKYFNNQEEYENNTGYGLDMTTYSKQASSDGANKLQNSVNGTFFGSTTYLIVESGSNKYIVKLANATKLLGGDQTVVEGQLVGDTIYWSNGTQITCPATSPMQLTEDLACPAFVVNEPNNTYGLRAESGVTNINFYLFNGMGIMLELYPKGHTVS